MATKKKSSTGSKKWIQEAIKEPGAFTKKAKKAKKSVKSYAKEVLKDDSKASTKTKKQANLALTLGKMAKDRKKSKK